MNECIPALASKAGIDPGNAQSGVAALLSTLQKFVPTETFSRVASAIPDSGSMPAQFQTTALRAAGSSATTGKLGGLF